MEALRRFNIPPGDYLVPCAGSMKEVGTPAFVEKMTKGPVAMMTVPAERAADDGEGTAYVVRLLRGGGACSRPTSPGGRWAPGTHYLSVFRFAGCTAFIGYSLALWQNTIWYKRNWRITLKSTIDGLVYGLLTAGTFGWLWPR